jgi:probable addiction module antidote protein
MGKQKTFPYDPADDLISKDGIAIFLKDAFETGDAAYIAKAFGIVARAKGMTELARDTGLSREQLYRSFSEEGNPTLKTIIAVMNALGIELSTKAAE